MPKRNILLVEPGYPNKYPPLGLMKIAAYHGPHGCDDNVLFVKGDTPEALQHVWDRVYVTTLFSFEWKRTSAAIDFALRAARGQAERVFVGGIAATLMFDEFVREPRWAGVRFVRGLLDQPAALSLHLSAADGDFGAHDIAGTPIEELVPDYGILEHTPYVYPVRDAYFGYASRGCVRKCSFCGVPKLEGGQREMPPLTGLVAGVEKHFGPKKDLILMDNNVAASSRYQEVVADLSAARCSSETAALPLSGASTSTKVWMPAFSRRLQCISARWRQSVLTPCALHSTMSACVASTSALSRWPPTMD